jgi:hypothetical protein
MDSGGMFSKWSVILLNNKELKEDRFKGYVVGANGFYVNSVCADGNLIQNYTQHQKKKEKGQMVPSFSGCYV